jgi:tellurite methyltransferase
VDEDLLTAETDRLGAQLGDPIKTTVVQNARCMTTWVLRKA